MTDRQLTQVSLKCGGCNAPFSIYHDSTPNHLFRVICKCGHETEWVYEPPLTSNGRGFGMKAGSTLPIPADLSVWSAEFRANG